MVNSHMWLVISWHRWVLDESMSSIVWDWMSKNSWKKVQRGVPSGAPQPWNQSLSWREQLFNCTCLRTGVKGMVGSHTLQKQKGRPPPSDLCLAISRIAVLGETSPPAAPGTPQTKKQATTPIPLEDLECSLIWRHVETVILIVW